MPGSATRFLLYSPDSYGLGHLRRSLSIGRGLSRAFPSATILCVTGSPTPHAFELPQRMDVLRLPSATKDDKGQYVPRELDVSFNDLIAMRSSMLDACIQSYRPDLILVDHAPLGMRGELLPALQRLQADRRATQIVLGLRDVYDDPGAVSWSWRRDGIPAALETIYDRILVYGQPSIFDLVQEYGLSAAVARKTTYTGYVYWQEVTHNPEAVRERYGAQGLPLVVVTVGGGQDGYEVIKGYLEGLNKLGAECQWRSLIVTGPLMHSVLRRRARNSARTTPGASMVTFTPHLQDLIAAADVVVTMGGYNSLVEVLARGKRTVVVPRVRPRREQYVRAKRFLERGFVRLVDPRTANGADVVRAVSQALVANQPEPSETLDFGGVDRAVQTVAELLHVPLRAPTGPPR